MKEGVQLLTKNTGGSQKRCNVEHDSKHRNAFPIPRTYPSQFASTTSPQIYFTAYPIRRTLARSVCFSKSNPVDGDPKVLKREWRRRTQKKSYRHQQLSRARDWRRRSQKSYRHQQVSRVESSRAELALKFLSDPISFLLILENRISVLIKYCTEINRSLFDCPSQF